MLHELRVYQIELEMQNEELRRAQTELDAARSRYFDLYDLAPVGYVTISERGLILEANFTAATLLGMARGTLARQPITRFILEADQDVFYLHRRKLFETGCLDQAGGPQACELRMVKKDGAVFWAHLSTTSAQSEMADGGRPVCRIGLSDVTQLKQAEVILKSYNEELERRVAERTAVAENRSRQLQVLDRRLIRAEEAERQRIAHVLHEEVQQILVAARMSLCKGLQQVTEETTKEPLLAVDRMLQEAFEETRALVHEMVPPGLREGGLLEAVTWLSRQMHERFDFNVAITANDQAMPPLDDEVSICAYQAVREMLLNIDKHAKVRQAEVVFMTQEDGWLNLTVNDTGTGFLSAETLNKCTSQHIGGLCRIRERVEGFGGRMEIVSSLGRGTSVSLFLPPQGSSFDQLKTGDDNSVKYARGTKKE